MDINDDKGSGIAHHELSKLEAPEEAAQSGHAIHTDGHGHALVQIDKDIERRIKWKMDIRLVPVLWFLYIATFIDRANIGNARLANLEADLGMTGYDFNTALSVLYVSFALLEIPSTIVAKLVGPGIWLPACTLAFGIISMCTAFVHNLGQLCAVRFFLGAAEAAMLPGILLYLSRWYRKDEVATRFALCIVSAPLAGAFGGLLAAAILSLDHIGSLTRWRQLFFVEGLATIGIAVVAYFLLTKDIDSARWLTPEEKAVANARIKSENVGTTTIIEKTRGRLLIEGIFNVNSMVLAFVFFWVSITVQVVALFIPTIIGQLFPTLSVVQKNLKTVPPYIVGGAVEVALAYFSERIRNRAIPLMISGFLVIVGFAMFVASADPNVGYGACFVAIMGAFAPGVFCPGWAAINTGTDSARATAIGAVTFGGYVGGLVGTWTTLSKDAPRFLPAQKINLASGCIIFSFAGFLWAWQVWENKQRDQGKRDHRLEGKSADEIALLGHLHPEFRYRH